MENELEDSICKVWKRLRYDVCEVIVPKLTFECRCNIIVGNILTSNRAKILLILKSFIKEGRINEYIFNSTEYVWSDFFNMEISPKTILEYVCMYV